MARPAASAKADWRAIETLRLALVTSLREAGVAFSAAVETADAWLLAGLAAEELNLGGASGALQAAAARDYGPVTELVQEVTRVTGLAIALPVSVGGLTRPNAQEGLPFSVFSVFRQHDDPFGTLAQALRTRLVGQRDDGPLFAAMDERRRAEGGYYTPYKLARRLVKRSLGELEAVPSVIDPACGAGAFLCAAFDELFERLEARKQADPSLTVEPVAWTVAALHGVETNPTALLAARLSVAVRAEKAERRTGGRGQLALFGQAQTYGPQIVDRLRLGDALAERPADVTPGTERLRRRLLARDEPGHLVASEPRPLRWDADFPLRFADDEGAFPGPGGFDLVLTNPPFVPIDRIPAPQRESLRAALDTYQRRYDLFIGFVERAATLLAPGGRATLLIPGTFLTENNAEAARELVVERMKVERLDELGPVPFAGAKVACVALTFSNRRPTEACEVEVLRAGMRKTVSVPQLAFRRAPRKTMRLELTDPAAAECVRLAESSIPLGRYLCASWGARGTPVGEFHLDEKRGEHCVPMVKGENVAPFVVKPAGKWLDYDVDRLYRPSRREFFTSEKLLVRKVTGRAGLVAAVDATGLYTDDSLACVVRKADLVHVPVAARKKHGISIAPNQIEPSRAYDLHLVCALLQSPLVQTYYRVQLGGGLNVFPELIEALPLPRPASLGTPEAHALARIGRACAAGAPFPADEADRLARRLFGL